MKQSQSSNLNNEGLALLRMKEKVVRDSLGGLSSWNGEYGVIDPCSWSGVECSYGNVVTFILRNNSFYGDIPKEILQLKELEVLDLGYNNFSGSFPSDNLNSNPSLTILLLDKNDYLANLSPEEYNLKMISEVHVHEKHVLADLVSVLVSVVAFVCFRSSKVVTVKPWTTGLSGQLQKAFITGVPRLERAELDAACADFSNIIGSLPDGTVYKGTLSSGVEIAVVSSAVTSSQKWSKNMEAQFGKKIEALWRVNHKNFVNLIGYCEENKPFTRMMVFEYAPNGTLFEHLHIRELEQLDWSMRMRIAMGIAYCLEHLHQLKPPISHRNLLSSSIYLTEDYAAKLSDLSFWNDTVSTKKGSEAKHLLETTSAYIKGNVYSFGVMLFELITGRIPYAVGNGFQVDWAAEYINVQPLRELVDISLITLKAKEIEKWCQVINNCVNPDPEKRPTMREVTNKLKEITAMGPDGATPKSSTLWWAELEIMSNDLS
ncbi:hypothetical protein TanjilG_06571 [Lupinus angustifolius]|uniref:Protein kinase domain-containing protein n=1 Tax=Lupinus angustifolius TaxID=3871 RepID=A0A394DAB1_LUPAN|nr:hypothetical protein TanjilG_06571 [Lupinus angustifolius]